MADPRLGPIFWIGVFLFFSGLILFLIGFSAPFWILLSVTGLETHYGLWMLCTRTSSSSSSSCVQLTGARAGSLEAARAMQCIGLIGFAVAFILFWFVVCNARFRFQHRRSFEITALVSTAFGLLGIAVYGGASSTSVESASSDAEFSWAFAIDLAGLIAILIAGVVLSIASSMETRYHARRQQKEPRGPIDMPPPPNYVPAEAYPMSDYKRSQRPTEDYYARRVVEDYPAHYTREVAPRPVRYYSAEQLNYPQYVRAPYVVPYGPPIHSRY